MPTLAIDARMLNSSGIGVYIRSLIPFLQEHFKLILIGDEDAITSCDWNFEYQVIHTTAPIYSLQEQLTLFKHIPACDLFWSPHYNVPVLPIAARKRIVTIHDTYHLAYKHTLSIAQKAFASVFLHQAVKRSHQVITVSEFSKREIIKYTHCEPEKISVIHNAADFKLFHERKDISNIPELRQAIPQLPTRFLLYVGNVKPHKNLTTLLRAYLSLSPDTQSQYKLVIVGQRDGFLTPDQSIGKLFQEYPVLEQQVVFTGFVPDKVLPLLYKYASLFIFPSVYEGFGLPPLEAMACGCPVLVSDAASMPEICGSAALYFNPHSVEDLIDKIKTILSNSTLQVEMVRKGLEHCKQYSWKKGADQHIKLFNLILTS